MIKVGKRFNPYQKFHGCYVPEWIAKRSELSQGSKLLYGRLIRYAGKDGKCNPRAEVLSEEIGVSRRQIVGYLKELRDRDLIQSVRRGRGHSNEYYFLFHDWIPDLINEKITSCQIKHNEKKASHQKRHEEKETSLSDEKDDSHPEEKYPSHPIYKDRRESVEESQSKNARDTIRKTLNGISPPGPAKDLFKCEGFASAYTDYWQYMKSKHNSRPIEIQVQRQYLKLADLQSAGHDPVAVINQTIEAGNKSFYELKNFSSKNGSATKEKVMDGGTW